MKKIKIMLDYKCFPVWMYNSENELIGNELPDEIADDIELGRLAEKIQEEYDNLFVDDETTFEYRGFTCTKGKKEFLRKIDILSILIKNKLGNNCIIENKVRI